jgi:hypothetical protein
VETEALLTGIAIGAARSDYYQTIEGRNYDYGTEGARSTPAPFPPPRQPAPRILRVLYQYD